MLQAVGKNKLKTSLIVLCIFVFVSVIVYYISIAMNLSYTMAATIAIGVSMAMTISSYWFSDKIVLSMNGAHPADEQTEKQLHNIMEGLCVASGLPMPKLYVVDDPSPNAFATGRNPQHAVVCVTTGLLNTMDYYQLEGVLAHEMAHIKNYDILLQTVASVMIGAAIMLANIWSRSLWWGGGRSRDRENNNSNAILMIIGLVFVILAPLAGQLLKMALSRNREYLADATAVEFTRNPEGLATALEKLGGVTTAVERASNATEGLYIANPLKAAKGSNVANLFSTHPPIEKRIEAIRNIR
jgi:heat shock protein HtpX